MTHSQDHNLVCFGCRRPRTFDYPCATCGIDAVVHANCGQAPEQQEKAAVEAYMRGMGWEWRPLNRLFYLAETKEYCSMKTAILFYRTHQAQVAVARLDELCRLIGKQENASEGSLINWGYVVPVPEIYARVAQLNPQKPKENLDSTLMV